MHKQAGFQLIELVVALAMIGLFAALGLPDLLRASARDRVTLAAYEVAGVFRLARATAMRDGLNVGAKFVTAEDGTVSYTLYRDADGDGVRNDDIAAGIDPVMGPPHRLDHLGPGVGFGILAPPAPRDPGSPRRRLDRLDDPIRFNNSDIAAVSSLGGATPGTVYLTDHRSSLAAVRVLGASGRVRILVYDPENELWRRP